MTAVEFIISSIIEDQSKQSKSMSEWVIIFEEAKQMEKQQTVDFAEKTRYITNDISEYYT